PPQNRARSRLRSPREASQSNNPGRVPQARERPSPAPPGLEHSSSRSPRDLAGLQAREPPSPLENLLQKVVASLCQRAAHAEVFSDPAHESQPGSCKFSRSLSQHRNGL